MQLNVKTPTKSASRHIVSQSYVCSLSQTLFFANRLVTNKKPDRIQRYSIFSFYTQVSILKIAFYLKSLSIMTPVALLFLAVSMSADAFAASISKGAELSKPRFRHAVGIGLVFGIIEAMTPVLGWVAGKASQQYVEAWDHWVAFTLLFIIGLHMMHEGLKKEEKVAHRKQTLWLLILTATATSLDAMAVGASLAFIDVNIITTSLAIGLATTVMASMGTLLGHKLGKYVGHWAELVGGVVLIGIGVMVVVEHTGIIH
jgi:putative Mn2+ efflux pump MntP